VSHTEFSGKKGREMTQLFDSKGELVAAGDVVAGGTVRDYDITRPATKEGYESAADRPGRVCEGKNLTKPMRGHFCLSTTYRPGI